MKLGAHVSIAGGYTKALEKIVSLGGNSLQIFSSSPRGWNFARLTDEDIKKFVELKDKLGIDPMYFHASYLINLGDNGRIGNLSKQLLKHELRLASKIGVKGSIVHLGSFKKRIDTRPLLNPHKNLENELIGELAITIKEILHETPPDTLFIIENAGTRKIGKDLREISQIIKAVNDNRLKVCLDTCHLHAASYDLRTEYELRNFLIDFESLIGLDRLELFHLNDSKDTFGSFRDRHENLGKGSVGISTFKLLLNHSQTRHKPFIIETPGFDDKGPDKQNLDILKNLTLTLP